MDLTMVLENSEPTRLYPQKYYLATGRTDGDLVRATCDTEINFGSINDTVDIFSLSVIQHFRFSQTY